MSATKTSLRQSVHRDKLDQLTTDAKYQLAPAGGKPAGSTEADNLLTSINSELTAPLRMGPTDPTADRIVHVDAISITNPETGKNRIAQSINGILPAFTGATITLPTTANGTVDIINSDGDNISTYSQTASTFVKCAVFLLDTGDLALLVGAEGASIALATYPGVVKNSISIGYFIIETDVSQAIQNVTFSYIYQMTGGGGAGSGDASSAGGGEIVDLTFRARLEDSFADKPDGTTPVDIAANLTDSSLYDSTDAYYRFQYDADKTVTTVGTACTISASPAFTIKAGDVIISGGEIRKISSIASQTSVTLEAAFSSDLTAAASCISQCIHSVDLNDFDNNGDGLAVNDQISDNVSDALVGYWDSSTSGDTVPNFSTTPNVAYSLSGDGSDWSVSKVRKINLDTTEEAVSVPTEGSKLYLRFFANKTSGNGYVNLLKFKAFWMPEVAELAGSDFLVAFARPNASVYQNVVHSVVGGKSRFTFNYAYGRGLETGNPAGSALEVIADGLQFPRYDDGTKVDLTSGYFKEIDDVTIELDTDYSSATIDFIFRVKNLVIDTRTQNTERITNIEDFENEAFQDFIVQDFVDAPHTEVVNRSQVVNLANDLMPRMGVNRIQTQDIFPIPNEFGPNGEAVFGLVNDVFNQIRFVGNWATENDTSGIKPQTSTSGDFVEITFYGTGLNYLGLLTSTASDRRVTVDGGSEGSDIYGSYSNILQARNYSSNQIATLCSGLSLGIHTVKLRLADATFMYISGFEVIDESTSLKVPTGNAFINRKKVSHNAIDTEAYNSGFESGTLGTKGGYVLTYFKNDGTMAKAVTPTEASAAYLASSDHSNEEIVRKVNFREFGAGRADDFSTLAGSGSSRTFTLDDGTTTLITNGSYVYNNIGIEGIGVTTNGNWQTLTFVGTGLDIINVHGTVTGTVGMLIDGASIGSLVSASGNGIIKVCSGLPYGTHTFKQLQSSSTPLAISDFIIYQPKKPTLPANAIEVSSYNIMADFVANTTVDTTYISTGVLRKNPSREMTYITGTGWNLNINANSTGGWDCYDSSNAELEYTFYGTGFDMRFGANTNRSSNIEVSLDGTTLTAANFPTASFSTYGTGVAFTSSTGVLDQNTGTIYRGCGFVCSGLPLGIYKVKFNDNGSSQLNFTALDIITPIHSAKLTSPASLQNSSVVGNQSIDDLRKLTAIKEVGAQSSNYAVVAQITASISTTSTALIPNPELFTVFKSKGSAVKLSFDGIVDHNGSGGQEMYFFIDGRQVGERGRDTTVASMHTLSNSHITYLSPGVHLIQVFWKATATTTIQYAGSKLTVHEIN